MSHWTHKSLVVFAACLIAFGCGKKPEQNPNEEEEEETVELKMSGNWGLGDAYKAIVESDDFKKALPNIKVEVIKQSGADGTKRVKTCVQDNTCYDIECIATNTVREIPKGILLDLGQFGMTLDEATYHQRTYVRGANGEIFAVPNDDDPTVVYYRLDLMKNALSRYNADHPGAELVTDPTSESQVQTFMDNLTWDDYVDKLSPYLLKTTAGDASDYNEGFEAYPVNSVMSVGLMFTNATASSWLNSSGQLNPDLEPYLRKHMDITRRLVKGTNNGVTNDPINSFVASVNAYRFRGLPKEQVPCSIADLSPTAKVSDLDMWSGPWFCNYNRGSVAIEPNANWFLDTVKTGASWMERKAPRTSEKWAVGKWRLAKPLGLKKGSFLNADVPHHYTTYAAGSSLAVPKTTKHPEAALKVIKYFTRSIEPQVYVYQQLHAFPAYSKAWDDPRVRDAKEEFFGNQAPGVYFANTSKNISAPGSFEFKAGPYDTKIQEAYQSLIFEKFDPASDLSDANGTALADSVITALKAKIVSITK